MQKARSSVQWIREERLPTLAELAWLASPEGEAVCRAMMDAGGSVTPALLKRWREQVEPDHVAAAAQQAQLRLAARRKFNRADAMLFDRVGLEQSSDEMTATWKARRFAGCDRVADLCCGVGGDAIALATAARHVVAADWSELKLALARHNLGVYERTNVATHCGDVTLAEIEADAVHIDPDRRALGGKRHDPSAGSPNLADVARLVERYRHAAIKFSPGADFTLLPFHAEIELISRDGECRQAVAWTGRLARARRSATVLPENETIAAMTDDELKWPAAEAPQPGRWLHEPDGAVVRANLVGVLARRHSLAPIDPQVAWLTGDRTATTAMLRAFEIVDVADWSLSKARMWLARHNVGSLDIKTRGFAGSPEEILRRLKLTGRTPHVLFLTRLGDRPAAILTRRRA